MKLSLPSPEILHDLATENWQLRWQVIELFNRVRFAIRDHARGSRQQQAYFHLGRRLAGLLHSPQDDNLHLIVTAAYFLGGIEFLFLIFQHLGIDDADDFYPGLSRVKKELTTPGNESSLARYFEILLSSPRAVESTTAIAAELVVRLFSPDQALPLLINIPHPETRHRALRLLARTHPGFSASNSLLTPPAALLRHPELLDFIALPLENKQLLECCRLAEKLLASGEDHIISIAIRAIMRLRLPLDPEVLDRIDEKNFPVTALKAALGDRQACLKLETEARSWRQRKRLRALPGLAHCNRPEALEILRERAGQHAPRERAAALQSLGENPSAEALKILLELLPKTSGADARRRLLELIARHPCAETDPRTADFLADWHDDPKLYPQLLECLERFGYGPRWRKIITGLNPPLTEPHLQEIALFMARYAADPAIRQPLTKLLFDLDWSFSFRLLSLLRPHLRGPDTESLIRLLQACEETRELTISELLTTVSDVPRFDDALALFLNRNPAVASQLLGLFVNRMAAGELAPEKTIISDFNRLDPKLRKLLLAVDNPADIDLESRLPLLYFQDLLRQTLLPGGHALAMVVHQTRRYNGYFRTLICEILISLIDNDKSLQKTEVLPVFSKLIDFIRQRPHYDLLRAKALECSAAIRRRSRELKVHQKVTQDRDLRVLKVRKTPSLALYSTK